MTDHDLRPFISGAYAASQDGEWLTSINPATEEALWRLPAGHPGDVDRAVRAARRATASWADDRDLRVTSLLALADLIDANAEELARLDTLEIGIPLGVTTQDATMAADHLRKVVGMLDQVDDDVLGPARRVPRGVVAVIAPWNFPFFVALTKAASALAVGNCVVLKPSELGSASALRLAELVCEAGAPAGVLNVVPGRGDLVGDALVRHPGVDQINFTGSLATGRAVLRASAEASLAPVLTELGGKSAHVVGEHAPDLDTVADAIAANIFWCAGQVCSSGSRLIVAEQHHDALVEHLVERAGSWAPRDPLDPEALAGPLGSEQHLQTVDRMVREAVEDGGVVRTGGNPGPRPGWFYQPTIITGVESAHRLFQEEVFGPVLAVTVVRVARRRHRVRQRNRLWPGRHRMEHRRHRDCGPLRRTAGGLGDGQSPPVATERSPRRSGVTGGIGLRSRGRAARTPGGHPAQHRRGRATRLAAYGG